MKNKSVQLNWPLVGNGHIIDYLAKILSSKRNIDDDSALTGAYIFCGPKDLGKATIANYFARSIMCQQRLRGEVALPCGVCSSCNQFGVNKGVEDFGTSFDRVHSDFFLLKKEEDKKNISIEQVRIFINDLHMSSFMNSYKIGLIKDADTMSEEAANALLKTLEEPKNRVVIILLAENIDAMPETIASRSQVFNFRPVASDVIYDYLIKEHKVNRSVAKNISRLSQGRPALAIKFLQEKDYYSDYMHLANMFLRFHGQDMNTRLEAVEELIGSKSSGQEAVRTTRKILNIWQAIIRDIILILNGQKDLVQHVVIDKDIEKISTRYKLGDLLVLIDKFNISKLHLEANVSPRHILENLVLFV